MQYFFLTLIFLFGAALGSFVMVIAGRYNTGLPFLKGRSVCFSCNTQLQNMDLFPIFSFIFLRGKCRHCGSKIPKEALIVEIIMGFLSVLASLKSGLFGLDFSLLLTTNYLLLTAIFGVILLISIYDLKHFIIPDSFLIFLFILSLLYLSIPARLASESVAGGFPSFHISILLNTYLLSLISGIVLTLPFLLIFLISRGTWFGFGDVKYILVLGFFLGFIQGLSAVILAFWIGAAFSLVAFILKRIKPHIDLPLLCNNFTIKSEIPFGPFLSLGTLISFLLNLDLFQINSLLNAI